MPETLADRLDAPWSIAFYRGTALVSERDSARVLEVGERGETRQVAKIEGVVTGGEGGLLGLAVRDGELFAYYTADDGTVPADNPFDGSPVYSYGHRNPQGIGWDAAGTMYATEFGQDAWDELNVIVPGGDYGWPAVEGIAGDDAYIDPVQQWRPSDASPSGLTVTDTDILIANLRGERLRVVPLDDLTVGAERFTGDLGRLRDVVTAPDGTVWMLTNNTDGRGSPRAGDDRIVRLDDGPG